MREDEDLLCLNHELFEEKYWYAEYDSNFMADWGRTITFVSNFQVKPISNALSLFLKCPYLLMVHFTEKGPVTNFCYFVFVLT